MIKRLFLTLIIPLAVYAPVFAEVMPLPISPVEIVSTEHDEIQVGDWIQFHTAKDVYVDGELFIKSGTPVVGVVDFYHPNGFCGDDAEIKFRTFYLLGENGKKTEFNYPISINEHVLIRNDMKGQTKHFLKTVIRGSEIFIEPDVKVFNVFLKR